MSNIRGGRISRRRRTTAIPAHSLPWMQPTTSTRRGAWGAPDSVAMIARPSADVADLLGDVHRGPVRADADQRQDGEQRGEGGHRPIVRAPPLGSRCLSALRLFHNTETVPLADSAP